MPAAEEVIDEVIEDLENYRGCEYDVYFLQCLTLTVINFMNVKEFVGLPVW